MMIMINRALYLDSAHYLDIQKVSEDGIVPLFSHSRPFRNDSLGRTPQILRPFRLSEDDRASLQIA
jgi:hypothetical protein